MSFITVRCEKCKNEQVINDKASSKIACLICDTVLAEPKGGKANITAIIVK